MNAPFIHMRRRAAKVGRRAVRITRSKPSAYIASGFVPSILPNDEGQCIWFEGSLEREMLVQLNTDRDSVKIDGNAPTFAWTDGLHWYDYRPQYVVQRHNGRKSIVAIHWGAVVLKYGLREVLALIEPFAREEGYNGIELWTDSQIRHPVRIANSNLLHSVASEKFEPALLERVLECAHKCGEAVPIGRLRRSAGTDVPSFRAIAKLISIADLVPIDPDQLIDDRLVVTARTILKLNGEFK